MKKLMKKDNINFLEEFLCLLEKYEYDFYSCECCMALSFKEKNDNYFVEYLTNKESLLKYLKDYNKGE